VHAINAEMAALADAAVADARAVIRNTKRAIQIKGSEAGGAARAAVAELERIAGLVEQIAVQTRTRLSGEPVPGSTRIVSLHDPDARPIVKGRLGRPVEFGYLAQVVDNRDGIVVDHGVHIGNPPDAPLLAPAIARIKARFGRAPRAAAADRGYGEAAVDAALTDAGVERVTIPRRGRPGVARQTIERARPFRHLVKWRTGIEGRISHLKHNYGWARTRVDGIDGARSWCGLGVFAHNAVKITTLIDDRDRRRATRSAESKPRPRAGAPPRAGPTAVDPAA
jgi:IS5 family transposase